MATATDAVSSGGERSTLGAGIAEHAAAVTLPLTLEPADSQGFSSLMNTFGERVVAASGRAKSEGGASRRSGIVSAAASLPGYRFETTPSPVQAEHRASLIDQDVWVEPQLFLAMCKSMRPCPPHWRRHCSTDQPAKLAPPGITTSQLQIPTHLHQPLCLAYRLP